MNREEYEYYKNKRKHVTGVKSVGEEVYFNEGRKHRPPKCDKPEKDCKKDCANNVYISCKQGEVGPQGPQGVAGIGAQGPQGSVGAQGFQGPGGVGVEGPQGVTGLQGFQGPEGGVGPQGVTGLQGPRGFQGPEGGEGPQGVTGLQGPRGFQGPEGGAGPQGATGFQGPRGFQGPEGGGGPQGPTGSQGYQGIQGPAGGEGPQGVTGSTGYQGDSGTPSVGPQGATGFQGEVGNEGPPGPPGVAPDAAQATLDVRQVLVNNQIVSWTNRTSGPSSWYNSMTWQSPPNGGPRYYCIYAHFGAVGPNPDPADLSVNMTINAGLAQTSNLSGAYSTSSMNLLWTGSLANDSMIQFYFDFINPTSLTEFAINSSHVCIQEIKVIN